MSKRTLIVLIILVAAGLGIWKLVSAFQKGGQLADQALSRFHTLLAAGDIDTIYKESSPRFQQKMPPATWQKRHARVREKLGAFKSGTRDGLSMNNNNGDNTISFTSAATFEKASATEAFSFDYNGDTPLLLDYEVKSPLLLE